MNAALLMARLLLASIFAVSGFAKLRDRIGTRKALQDFGIPHHLVAPAAIVLPVIELATAVLLIPQVTAWWGALGALGLLGVFTSAIAVKLSKGQTPDCHCFGQLHIKPISWKTLVRNLVLLLVAGFLVGFGRSNPGLSILAWREELSLLEQVGVLSLLLNGVLFAGIGWFLFLLWHQQGRILSRLEAVEADRPTSAAAFFPNGEAAVGLPAGSEAPDFTLPDLAGRTVARNELLARGKPVLMLFMDPHCGPCNALLPAVQHWQQTTSKYLSIVVVSRGTAADNSAKKAEYGIKTLLLQEEYEVAKAYRVGIMPGAVLIQPDGRIGRPAAAGAEAITKLVAEFMSVADPSWKGAKQTSERQGQHAIDEAAGPLSVGEPAPQLTLPDLDGQPVNLADFLRGRETLMLFWDPGCSFCMQMIPQLRAWETFPPPNAPQLLLISAGTSEANQAMDLKAKILLDNELTLAEHFGARGTPSGVRFNAEGQIASSLVAGSSAILKNLMRAELGVT